MTTTTCRDCGATTDRQIAYNYFLCQSCAVFPKRIFITRKVSAYFVALENDAIAWTVEPEYRFLKPTLLAWLAAAAPEAI